VHETFDNDHRIVNQKGENKGRFTFTAGDSGQHKLCFTPTGYKSHSGWLSGGHEVGGIKITLDMAIGETSNIESSDKGKIQDIVSKVKDLNGRLQDIKREQMFQRVSGLIQVDENWQWLTVMDRSVRLNSGISQKLQTLASFDGLLSSLLFLVLLAHGNCPICEHSSSSRSSPKDPHVVASSITSFASHLFWSIALFWVLRPRGMETVMIF
jgi:hypothetical protein